MLSLFKSIQFPRLHNARTLSELIVVAQDINNKAKNHPDPFPACDWILHSFLKEVLARIPKDTSRLADTLRDMPDILRFLQEFQNTIPSCPHIVDGIKTLRKVSEDNWEFQKQKLPTLLQAIGIAGNSLTLVKTYNEFHNCWKFGLKSQRAEWIQKAWPLLKDVFVRIGENIEDPNGYQTLLDILGIDLKSSPDDLAEFTTLRNEVYNVWLATAQLLQPKYKRVSFAAFEATCVSF